MNLLRKLLILQPSLSLGLLLVQPVQAEEGLFRAKDTRVPGVIEIAGESVLQMVLVGEPATHIPAAQYPQYINAQAGENFILALTIQKVKRCQERSLPTCEVNYKSWGSAFVTDDGRTLWTARHVLAPQLGGKLNFELYNSDGEELFDSTDSKDQVSITFAGQESLIQKRHAKEFIVEPGLQQLSSDYIKLRLNRNLAVRALRVAGKRPRLGEKVYSVGYANVTGYRAVANAGGGTKTRSRVAIGVVSNYTEARAGETPPQKQSREILEGFIGQHIIIMDLDGLPGQSGSPVLNEAGEVVGIFVAGNSTIAGRGSLRGMAPHFEGINLNGH